MTELPSPNASQPRASGHVGLGRFVAALVATAAVALAVAALPVVALRPEALPPTPTPGLLASQGPLRFVPDPGTARRRTLARELTEFLRRLYDTAFFQSDTASPSPESPSPAADVRLAPYFAARARAVLASRRDAFTVDDRVIVRTGRLTFQGVVVAAPRAEAFLDVDFVASGAARSSPVRLTHKGRILLIRVEQGWLVTGFDVALNAAPPTPSPSPSPTGSSPR